jgi:hypothetical protein
MYGINGIFAYHPAANLSKSVELVTMRQRAPDLTELTEWWAQIGAAGLGTVIQLR